MTTTPKHEKIDALLAELRPITEELNTLQRDADGQLRMDTTAAEDAREDLLLEKSTAITMQIAAVTRGEDAPRTFTGHDVALAAARRNHITYDDAAQALDNHIAQIYADEGRPIDRGAIKEPDVDFLMHLIESDIRDGHIDVQ